ncbi:MAG: hypothetical protein Q8876_00890 [Bacillota bacterium]|nr:hypothetical protein [Bacillota bacterium]
MKIKLFVCFLVILIFLNGCKMQSENKNNSLSNSKTNDISGNNLITNETLSIYDINNKVIGTIEHYGAITQTDDSIIYTTIPNNSTQSITEIDYYQYVFKTKDRIKLGTVKNWSYQTADKVFINNHLYTYITTDMDDANKRTLKFVDIDLINHTMSDIFSEKGGFPYNSMAVVGNQVLMAKVLANGCDLEEYNPETKKMTTLKRFDFNDKTNIGETIRQINADNDTISLLMLKKRTSDSVKLVIDIYDHNMNFLHSVDMSSISSDKNELRQGVSHFIVSNNYIYYENFSSTRFLGEIEGNNVVKIMETDATFEKAFDIVKNERTNLFYQSYNSNKDLYLLNNANGTIQKTTVSLNDKRYSIINISRDTKDNCLLTLYYKDPNTGDTLVPKLYYINLSNLKWRPS